MLDFFDSFLSGFFGFTTALAIALLLVIGVLVVWRRIVGRKQVLFDSWQDLRTEPDATFGRSVAEMLLYRLRAIQRTHERSVGQVDISDTYRDVPTFAQGLDEDLQLLASAELGATPGALRDLLVLLLRAFPFLSPRTHLRGSIHVHGRHQRLQAMLENYRHPVTHTPVTRLWEVVTEAAAGETVPDAVEELAYRIYSDLLRDDIFKSWECFKLYTEALEHHVDFLDLARDEDDAAAESCYRAALEREPRNPVVNYNLGVLVYMRYRSEEMNREAMEYFRAALNAPNDRLRARANAAMANALLQHVGRFEAGGRGELEAARQHATSAVGIQPDLDAAAKALGYAHHMLGERLYKEQQDGQAVASDLIDRHRREGRAGYERALRLNAKNYVAANNLANLLLEWAYVEPDGAAREALLRDAERKADASLRVRPGYHHAHDNLGNIRLARGDLEGAVDAYEAALRYEPSYAEARNDIAMVLLDARYDRHGTGAAAVDSHARALKATGPDSARQRKKLCRQFSERRARLHAEGNLVEGVDALLSVDETPCGCRAAVVTEPVAP